MSIDVLFQALDLTSWERQVFPYLRGEGTLTPLFAEARRVSRLRNIVSQAKDLPYVRDPAWPDWYDHDLQFWFRPFCVVVRDAAEVARTVAAYHKASPRDAVALVREQVRLIDPARADAVKVPKGVKAESERIAEMREGLVAFRKAYAVLARSTADDSPKGLPEAIALYNSDIYQDLLRLNEQLQPVWHVRAWFIKALMSAFPVLGWKKLCELMEQFYSPLFDSLGETCECLLAPDDLGFGVRAENVPKFRAAVAKVVKRFGDDLSGDSNNRRRSMISLLEALTYAEQEGLSFAERIN
jgi:hypothetical protein